MFYKYSYRIVITMTLIFAIGLQPVVGGVFAAEIQPVSNVTETVEKAENLPSDAMEVSDSLGPIILFNTVGSDEKEHCEIIELSVELPKLLSDRVSDVEALPSEAEDDVKYFDVPLSEDLQDYIFELCKKYKIDPALVIALIKRESNFKSDIISYSGSSYGLMQINKKWHIERMKKVGCTDLLDPYQNVTVGIDLLAELYRANNSTEWVLMAYNKGYSYANQAIAEGSVSEYAQSIIDNSKSLEGR